METINLKNGQTLEIYQDESGFSPREWDNMSTLYCWHKNYNLGDSHDYEYPQHFLDTVDRENDILVSLYFFEHSGCSISTSPFICPWDSGQVGWAYISKETIIKEYGEFTEENKAMALRCLEAEVETYDHYIQGSVYGYILKDAWDREIDSCWGFYGYDHEKSGLFDHAGVLEYVA